MLDMGCSSPVATYEALYSDVDNAKRGKRQVDSEKNSNTRWHNKAQKKAQGGACNQQYDWSEQPASCIELFIRIGKALQMR